MIFHIFLISKPAISKFGWKFLIGQNWDPVQDIYGAAPVIFGTFSSTFIALCISFPISIGVALFITDITSRRIGVIVGFFIEMLAAIPSVVYGLWGIFVLSPFLRNELQPFLEKYLGFLPLFRGPHYGIGLLAAGIILSIMIIPTIATICREVFHAVPVSQREAALALGSTKWEMIRLSVLKSSASGIFGAVILGMGRAMGETMAVSMLIGNKPIITSSLFSPAQTMASAIANEYAEATSNLHLASLAYIGFTLFIISLIVNSLARVITNKSRRRFI